MCKHFHVSNILICLPIFQDGHHRGYKDYMICISQHNYTVYDTDKIAIRETLTYLILGVDNV